MFHFLRKSVPFHLVLETQISSCSTHLSVERFILSVKNGSHWKRRMKSNEREMIKVQQVFFRLPFEKSNYFEIYRNYVINFCLFQQRNTNLNLTPEKIRTVVKPEPHMQ